MTTIQSVAVAAIHWTRNSIPVGRVTQIPRTETTVTTAHPATTPALISPILTGTMTTALRYDLVNTHDGKVPSTAGWDQVALKRWAGRNTLPTAITPAPDPDQAWRVLELTTRWIVHADGKAGLTLASVGVTGGVLYNVVQSARHLDVPAACAAGACALLVLAASLCAVASLWSRVRASEKATSLLFFHNIARRYPTSADTYAESLRGLTREPEALTEEIAAQIWANSHIAARKYFWANLSLGGLSAGVSIR
jgi:hypothetical protein